MKTCEIVILPENLIIKTSKDKNLYFLLRENKIEINSACGGKGICGKCKVKIEGDVSPLTSTEEKFLTEKEIKKGLRLCCQVYVKGNIKIEIKKGKERIKGLTDLLKLNIKPEPGIKKKYLKVSPPSLLLQSSDLKRVKNSLGKEIKTNLTSLSKIPYILRNSDHKITVVFDEKELLSVESGNTTKKFYGIALDIGTTTIAAYLIDLKKGKNLSVYSTLNPQIRYGEDVISRINTILEDGTSLYKMHNLIIEKINEIINFFTAKTAIEENYIYKMVVVGNPCMIHLFLGINPAYLSRSPYIPVISESFEIKAKEMGIKINPEGKIEILPAVSGFFGADALGMVLKERIYKYNSLSLGIDLGTNGEIVLGNREKILCTSCAAGPAFEGTKIYQGMIAQEGGINYVKITPEKVIFKTIGNKPPIGICGCGIVDAISEMLKFKIIDSTGRIKNREEYQKEFKNSLYKRIKIFNNANSFIIATEEETENGFPIIITQKDVREVQLAKSAISSAIKILCKKLSLKEEKIYQVFLAGSFGNYLNVESAVRIGIIPECLKDRVKVIGNSAGEAAAMCLISEREKKNFERISKKLTYIELSLERNFQEEFAKSIYF